MWDSSVCKQKRKSCYNKFLQLAPCPPPVLTYELFKEYAFSKGLLLPDVCVIAKKCMLLGHEIDCQNAIVVPDVNNAELAIPVWIVVACILVLLALILSVFVKMYVCRRRRQRHQESKVSTPETHDEFPLDVVESAPLQSKDAGSQSGTMSDDDHDDDDDNKDAWLPMTIKKAMPYIDSNM